MAPPRSLLTLFVLLAAPPADLAALPQDQGGRKTSDPEAQAEEPEARSGLPAESDDWIAERWPIVTSLSRQIAAGERGSAVAALTAWLEPGIEALSAGLEPEQSETLCRRIDALAGPLGLLQIQLDARTAILASLVGRLPEDAEEIVAARESLGVTCGQMGDIERALGLLEQVHEAYERSRDPDDLGLLWTKMNLSAAHAELGHDQRARELLQHVVSGFEAQMDPEDPNLLWAQQQLAGSLMRTGDLEGGLELMEEVHAVSARTLPPDDHDLLWAKQNLAEARAQLGDREGALELREVVHSAYARLYPPDHPDLLWARTSLAASLAKMGDKARALKLYEQVLEAYERLLPPDHLELLATRSNVASLRLDAGDFDGALELAEQVHVAFERVLHPRHPKLLRVKRNLAIDRQHLGDDQGALELRRYVHDTFAQMLPAEHPDRLGATLSLLGSLRQLEDRVEFAALLEDLLAAQRDLAESLWRQAPRVARSVGLREMRRLAQLLSWITNDDLTATPTLASQCFETLESLRLVATRTSQTARAAAGMPEVAELQAELSRVRRALAEQSLELPTEEDAIEGWRRGLVGMAEERDRLEAGLRRALEDAGHRAARPRVATIAARLEADEVLVSYLRFERQGEGSRSAHVDSLVAFVVLPEGDVERVELGPVAPIADAVAAWRASLGRPLVTRGLGIGPGDPPGQAELEDHGELLRALVLDPVLEAAPDAQLLHVVLDDLLFLVPLDALPWLDGHVGDRVELRTLTSVAPLLDELPQSTRAPSLVAIGGVDYGARLEDDELARPVSEDPLGREADLRSVASRSNFDALPGTLMEVLSIRDSFESRFDTPPLVLDGSAASKARFLEVAPSATYLHIATHGWFAPAADVVSSLDASARDSDARVERTRASIVGFLPETLCGLALAGANNGSDASGRVPGILTAEELSTVDLARCELAVLSACETNVGIRRAGQGIQSLQAALHGAGARTAITSLWKVEDSATRRLFELFYGELWQQGRGKAEALWRAKVKLREEGHPLRDWAGWVLTGDPD